MKHSVKFALLAIGSAALVACGGGGGGGGAKTGVLVDSLVQGIQYKTSSGQSGKTNDKGEFSYVDGDQVRFMVGNLTLGSATAAPRVHISQITPQGAKAPSHDATVRMAQLLQTLDMDANPANGIKLYDKIETVTNLPVGALDLAKDFASEINAWRTQNGISVHVPVPAASAAANIDAVLAPVSGTDCVNPSTKGSATNPPTVTNIAKLTESKAFEALKGKTFTVIPPCAAIAGDQTTTFDANGGIKGDANRVKQALSSAGVSDDCDKAGACTVRASIYTGDVMTKPYLFLVTEETITSTGKTNRYAWAVPYTPPAPSSGSNTSAGGSSTGLVPVAGPTVEVMGSTCAPKTASGSVMSPLGAFAAIKGKSFTAYNVGQTQCEANGDTFPFKDDGSIAPDLKDPQGIPAAIIQQAMSAQGYTGPEGDHHHLVVYVYKFNGSDTLHYQLVDDGGAKPYAWFQAN